MNNQNFAQALNILKGQQIGAFLNNGQFVDGLLIAVKKDHITVNTQNRNLYILNNQIHAISKNTKDNRVSNESIHCLDESGIIGILRALKNKWITVNSLNNQTFVGLLTVIGEDHIILINGEKILYIQKTSITNLCKGTYYFQNQPNDTIKKQATEQPPLELNNESEKQLEPNRQEAHLEEQIKANQLKQLPEPKLDATLLEIEEWIQDELPSNQVQEFVQIEEKGKDEDKASENASPSLLPSPRPSVNGEEKLSRQSDGPDEVQIKDQHEEGQTDLITHVEIEIEKQSTSVSYDEKSEDEQDSFSNIQKKPLYFQRKVQEDSNKLSDMERTQQTEQTENFSESNVPKQQEIANDNDRTFHQFNSEENSEASVWIKEEQSTVKAENTGEPSLFIVPSCNGIRRGLSNLSYPDNNRLSHFRKQGIANRRGKFTKKKMSQKEQMRQHIYRRIQ
ncbi:hypothetical protein [Virgibacillus halodenitrificans]|uniref:hypothetical protein n=1 Tax=Virgibacillus halodenitrificans TaxID=1482 RepID=UPI002DB5BA20|nr:hypothetical protein [Virgibacillus halodenitrificans]MEC2159378.1 hypothetical protein [Virgibacillus halodenitrificans]